MHEAGSAEIPSALMTTLLNCILADNATALNFGMEGAWAAMRWHWDRRLNLENIGKYPLKHLAAVGITLVLLAAIAVVYNVAHALLAWLG